MSAPVFFVDVESAVAATPGGSVVLEGAEGKHAAVVQRLRSSEPVELVDGRGTRLVGSIAEVDGPRAVVEVDRVEHEERDALRLVLVQALAKGDRDELAVQAATELGVDAVVPWQAERSVVVWRGSRAARSRARWAATVRAATKQSRRAWEPEVGQLTTSTALAARVRSVVEHGGAALVLQETATSSVEALAQRLHRLVDSAAPGTQRCEILVVVGPEGGISDDELTVLSKAGGSIVRLGPHVLRTSTAGPAALVWLADHLGRWK